MAAKKRIRRRPKNDSYYDSPQYKIDSLRDNVKYLKDLLRDAKSSDANGAILQCVDDLTSSMSLGFLSEWQNEHRVILRVRQLIRELADANQRARDTTDILHKTNEALARVFDNNRDVLWAEIVKIQGYATSLGINGGNGDLPDEKVHLDVDLHGKETGTPL